MSRCEELATCLSNWLNLTSNLDRGAVLYYMRLVANKVANDLAAQDQELFKLQDEVQELEEQNAALTAQLEEVRGKLVMLTDALSEIEGTWSELHQKEVDGWNEPSKIATKALQALSPDIKRFREEIEREAREKAIQDCLKLLNHDYDRYKKVPPSEHKDGALLGFALVEESLLALLPKQKEVSDE